MGSNKIYRCVKYGKDVLLVVPDVGNYPFTTINKMLKNTQICLHWIINNIEQYGGDPSELRCTIHVTPELRCTNFGVIIMCCQKKLVNWKQ